ncbi:MAG: transcription antitermination factor NusB [Phycisphaerae bacterium]|nr:transcription antitermination factor NusB [Phycisphaerae bacterium]
MPHRKRSQARMLALQALCLYDALGAEFDQQIDRFLTDTSVHHELGIQHSLTPEIISFARELACEAWSRRNQYNEMLGRAVHGWSVRRMPPVDRNILRLGFYELFEHPETPHQVVINEAIELARRFGDADSPAFVNGVLDAIWRDTGLSDNGQASSQPTGDPQHDSNSSPDRD